MKKSNKMKWCSAMLAITLTLGNVGSVPVEIKAAELPELQKAVVQTQKPEAVDMDSYTENFSIDYNKLQLQPVYGWFTETVSEGRTVKVYISEEAGLRARFTVVAVPDGVDTWEFLDENGWFEQADEKRECLFILEPGSEGWGDVEAERSYVKAAMSVLTSQKNHNGVTMFNTFGTFAVTGYDKGCAPLEAWVLQNPLHIYSQVYIGGESAGEAALQEARDYVYDHNFPGPRQITPEQFADGMASIGLTVDDAGHKSDVPIPTWFVDYDKEDPSVEFWKTANDVVSQANEDGVYYQSIDSDAFQTLYANKIIKNWEPDTLYGLSQVRVTEEVSVEDIYEFTGSYMNYTALCSYSNNLASRMSYAEVMEASIDSAKTGVKGSYEYTNFEGKKAYADLYAMESMRVQYDRSNVGATLYAGSIGTWDYDGNGTLDPREILIYVPDSASKFGKEGAPMVLVNPGSSQTCETFLDCSGWVPVANDEGCVLVIINQPCNTATSVRYQQADSGYVMQEDPETADFSRGLMSYMKNGFQGAAIDFTRVYVTGHSAGSNASEQLGLVSDGDWIAAIGSTSLISNADVFADGIMPTYVMVGQTDLNDYRVDLVSDPYVSKPTVEGAGYLHIWLNKLLKKNGINKTIVPDDKEAFLASCSSIDDDTRYLTYNWENEQGIELIKFGRTYLREHNCYPEEARLAWDYMEQFRLINEKDGTQTRLYSESAFTEDDAIVIGAKKDQKITTKVTSSILTSVTEKPFQLKAETSGNGKLTYKSSNSQVAKVSKDGLVTIKGTGKATITITAHSTATCNMAVKKIVIRVVPDKAVLKNVEAVGKGAIQVSVKKDPMADGYMIQYSADKNFKKFSTVVLDRSGRNSIMIKKVKAGKCYVRACSYTSIGGNKYCGAYSDAVKVKVK
ncbi:MAG: Ig-like domain-containing protein [Clostridiales bacterium]|nr:Ig-like domain-containing protein [Clostridiales bacterium]